jgi:hypothetical protein
VSAGGEGRLAPLGRTRAAGRAPRGARRGARALAIAVALQAAGPARASALIVDARSLAPSPDGSREKPFRTVGAALAAARDGDALEIRAGLYPEPLRILRPVVLRGPRTAVLVGEDPARAVVEVAAPAALQGLTIQGGAVGVEARAPVRLEELAFSAQRRSPVRSVGARVEVSGGRFSALFDRSDLFGIDAEGGELHVRGARFEGPFRFAIRARGARLWVEGARIEDAVGGIACLAGCVGEVRGSVLAQGRGPGLFASASRLWAVDNLVSRYEYCALARDGAHLRLEDNAVAFCEVAGVATVESELVARHHLHVGACKHAAIEVDGGSTLIDEGALIEPGPAGILSRLGSLEVRGTAIVRASPERDGTFGDGVFAYAPEALRVDGAMLEGNRGAGVAVQDGRAEIVACEIRRSGVAGVEAQRGARVQVRGAHVGEGDGPAVSAIEGSQVRVEGGVLEGLAGAAWASCADGATVRLSGVRGSLGAAPAACITRE